MAETIEAVLKLDGDRFVAGIQRIQAQLEKFDAEAAQIFDNIKNSAKNLEGIGNLVGALGIDQVASRMQEAAGRIAGVFGTVVNDASNFQASMLNVNTVVQLGGAEFDRFSDRIANLGKELGIGVGPAEAAAGAYDIVSAGFSSAADAEAVLRESLRGAKASTEDAATAADLLTTTLASYSLKAQDAARVNDILFTIVQDGKSTYGELAQSFGEVSATAAANGVSLEDLAATLAVLTKNGVKTPQAITAVRAAIVALGAPTEESIKAQKELGLSINRTTLQQQGLGQTLLQVTTAAGNNTSALRRVLGDVNALNAAYNVAKGGGSEYRTELDRMAKSAGATDKALEQQQKSFKANLDQFSAAVERLAVGVGNELLPALTGIVKVATGFVDFIDGLPEPIKLAGLALLGMQGASLALNGALLGLVAPAVGVLGVLKGLGVAIPSVATASTALTAAVGRAGTSLAGFGASAAGIAGPLALIVALAAGAVIAYDTLSDSIDEATQFADSQIRSQAAANQSFHDYGFLLNSTAQELQRMGIRVEELTGPIKGLQQQIDLLKSESPNSPLLPKLEEDKKKAEELQASLIKLYRSQAQGAQQAAQVAQQTAKERKELVAQEVHDVKISQQSDRDKADSLDLIIRKYALVGQERRSIESEISSLTQKAQREEQQGIERTAQAQLKLQDSKITGLEKQLELGLDVEEKLVAAIKRRTDLEVAAINQKRDAALQVEADPGQRSQIARQAALEEAQVRTAGEQKVTEARKSAEDAATKLSKDRVDREVQANQLAQQGIEQRLQGLQREAALGANNLADQEKLIKQKAQLQADSLKKQAEQASKETKDPAVRAGIQQNLGTELGNLQKQTELDLQQLQKDTAAQKVQQAQGELSVLTELKNAQIGALKAQAEAGKNVSNQLIQAIKDRLDLQIQEIELQKQAALAATNSATQRAAIEQAAEVKIAQAKLATRKEIDETVASLKKQKAAQDSLSGVGDTQTLEEFLKSQSDQFGIGSTRKRIAEQQAANAALPGASSQGSKSGIAVTSQDVLNAATKLVVKKPETPTIPPTVAESAKQLAQQDKQLGQTASNRQTALSQNQAAFSTPTQQPTTALGRVEVLVGVDPNNGQIEIESVKPDTTANGKGSKLEIVAGGLSPRNNTGGP